MTSSPGNAGGRRRPYDPEGLGDDFRMSHWVEPTEEKARRNANKAKFREGTAPFCGTQTSEFGEMGVGIPLYFRFVRFLTWLFLAMTIAAAPALVFSWVGTRVRDDEVDALGVSRTTIGNIGAPTSDLAFRDCDANPANCTDIATIRVGGRSFSLQSASYLITAGDVLYSLIFLAGYFILRGMIHGTVEAVSEEHSIISPYAVVVKNLPKNATEEEIRLHFSLRYQLETDERHHHWCCCRADVVRPAPTDPPVRPVSDCSNTNDGSYLGGWVAEVAVSHFNGGAIRAIMTLANDVKRLRAARARVKKYSPGTPLMTADGKSGADEAKKAKAEKRLARLERKMERIRNSVLAWDLHQASQTTEQAFVVFDHPLSQQRCLADYHGSKTSCGRCLQPRRLLFRGRHALRVEQAPSASDVIWEHLGTSLCSKYMRRALTALVMAALLVGSFLAIVAAQNGKAEFSSTAPKFADCQSHVYAQVHDAYPATSATADADAAGTLPELYRDKSKEAEHCKAGTHFVWYEGTDAARALRHLEEKTDPSTWGACDSPCVPASDSSERCPVLSCTRKVSGIKCPGGPGMLATTRVGCYCMQLLQKGLGAEGGFSAASKLFDDESEVCGRFAETYFAAQGLTIGAAVTVIVVNVILKIVMKKLVIFERHSSRSNESRELAKKLFLAQFLNTAILTLVVYARLPNGISFPAAQTVELFNGEYDDFNGRWYAAVGSAIALTVIFNAFAPHVVPVLNWLVLARCKRRCCRWRKETQEELDSLYAGAEFNIAVQYAVTSQTVFSVLLYCGGMPLLLPIAFMAFLFQAQFDKYLLLRFYAVPPHYDESLTKHAVALLPYALVLHLGVSAWMYGNNDVLKSDLLDSSALTGASGGNIDSTDATQVSLAYDRLLNQTATIDPLGVGPKLARTNVFPVALLFFLVSMWILVRSVLRIVGPIVRGVIFRSISVCTCGLCCADRGSDTVDPDDAAATMHKYTGIYGQYVPPYTRLTADERKRGWILVRDGEHVVKYLTWTSDEPDALGVRHPPKSFKLTWHKVMESGLHSYHMSANPKYRRLARTWEDITPEASAKAKASRAARARAAAEARRKAEEQARAYRAAMAARAAKPSAPALTPIGSKDGMRGIPRFGGGSSRVAPEGARGGGGGGAAAGPHDAYSVVTPGTPVSLTHGGPVGAEEGGDMARTGGTADTGMALSAGAASEWSSVSRPGASGAGAGAGATAVDVGSDGAAAHAAPGSARSREGAPGLRGHASGGGPAADLDTTSATSLGHHVMAQIAGSTRDLFGASDPAFELPPGEEMDAADVGHLLGLDDAAAMDDAMSGSGTPSAAPVASEVQLPPGMEIMDDDAMNADEREGGEGKEMV